MMMVEPSQRMMLVRLFRHTLCKACKDGHFLFQGFLIACECGFSHFLIARIDRSFVTSQEIILVEAVKLDDVTPGVYNVHCLPLRLFGAEGAPIRCILIK